MANRIIRFFPRPDHKEAKTCKIERLVTSAWKFSHCALWAEQSFTRQEEEATKDYIREYLSASTDLQRAFIALVQRIILTQKYAIRSTDGTLPAPIVWFNCNYPFGFAGSMAWLQNVDQQRKKVPGYLAHLEVFAQGYYQFAVSPTTYSFQKCRKKLLKHRAQSLIQLFYNTIIYTDYIRA